MWKMDLGKDTKEQSLSNWAIWQHTCISNIGEASCMWKDDLSTSNSSVEDDFITGAKKLGIETRSLHYIRGAFCSIFRKRENPMYSRKSHTENAGHVLKETWFNCRALFKGLLSGCVLTAKPTLSYFGMSELRLLNWEWWSLVGQGFTVGYESLSLLPICCLIISR